MLKDSISEAAKEHIQITKEHKKWSNFEISGLMENRRKAKMKRNINKLIKKSVMKPRRNG